MFDATNINDSRVTKGKLKNALFEFMENEPNISFDWQQGYVDSNGIFVCLGTAGKCFTGNDYNELIAFAQSEQINESNYLTVLEEWFVSKL